MGKHDEQGKKSNKFLIASLIIIAIIIIGVGILFGKDILKKESNEENTENIVEENIDKNTENVENTETTNEVTVTSTEEPNENELFGAYYKKAEELSSKPILSLNVFVENVSKLKTHFEEIEDYRAQVAIEAKKEQENFDNARKSLASIKLLTKQQSDELEHILNK